MVDVVTGYQDKSHRHTEKSLACRVCDLLHCTQASSSWSALTDLSYNIALCYYSQKLYGPAMKYIADIIERGIREHPGMPHLSAGKIVPCFSVMIYFVFSMLFDIPL